MSEGSMEALAAVEIAVRIKRSRPDTSRALRTLCDQGYVVQGFGEGGIPIYQINLN